MYPSICNSNIYLNVNHTYFTLIRNIKYMINSMKAVWYSCTLSPPCTGAMSPTHCSIMWLPIQCHIPIIASQWVLTMMLLHNCHVPHFIKSDQHFKKQHFVHWKFEQNYRLVTFNSNRISFLNTLWVSWCLHFNKSVHQTLHLRQEFN